MYAHISRAAYSSRIMCVCVCVYKPKPKASKKKNQIYISKPNMCYVTYRNDRTFIASVA